MRTLAIGALLASAAFFAAAPISATTINFDNIASGVAVTTQYSSLGVTFTNAQTTSVNVPGASLPNEIVPITNNGFFTVYNITNAIGATFSGTAGFVSLMALDVGAAGFKLDAFNSLGQLIGSDQITHPGIGTGNVDTLTIATSGIASVKFYQIGDGLNLGDGVLVDNFSFLLETPSAIPEPTTWAMMIGGFGLVGSVARRRKAAVRFA